MIQWQYLKDALNDTLEKKVNLSIPSKYFCVAINVVLHIITLHTPFSKTKEDFFFIVYALTKIRASFALCDSKYSSYTKIPECYKQYLGFLLTGSLISPYLND